MSEQPISQIAFPFIGHDSGPRPRQAAVLASAISDTSSDREAEPAPEDVELSSEGLFDMRLGALCIELAQARKDELIEQVRTLTLQRSPLCSADGTAKNFWDEYSLRLANDDTYGQDYYDQELAAFCRKVLDTLSTYERTLLESTTEQYQTFWDENKQEPASTIRCWLIQEIFDALTHKALNYGEKLRDGGEDE